MIQKVLNSKGVNVGNLRGKKKTFTHTMTTLKFLPELQFRIRELINFIYNRTQWSFVSKLTKFGVPECAGFIKD